MKGKDSKVSPDLGNITGYYEVGYYFGLIEDYNSFSIDFTVISSSLLLKRP